MDKSKTLPVVDKKVEKIILEKTDPKYIKTRRGGGGMMLSYVEGGYVQAQLNKAFGYLWSFRILSEQVGKKQVYVKGQLTINLAPDLTIVKEQFGGADIKTSRTTSEPLSIADDLKAAATDSLKKCASIVGIAQDVYWRDSEGYQEEEQPKAPQYAKAVTAKSEPDPDWINEDEKPKDAVKITSDTKLKILTTLPKKGKSMAALQKVMQDEFQKKALIDLTESEGKFILNRLAATPDVKLDDDLVAAAEEAEL